MMRWTRKLALKQLGLAKQMFILASTLVASTLLIYMIGGYPLPMPYSLIPYLYHMSLAMLAPASLTLLTRQALTPSPKAVMQLLIR